MPFSALIIILTLNHFFMYVHIPNLAREEKDDFSSEPSLLVRWVGFMHCDKLVYRKKTMRRDVKYK